jgi:Zn-dependent metalloprotease
MTQYMIEPHIDQINFSSRKQRNECLCFIIPGHILQHIVRNTDDEELRESTFNTLALSEQARGRRQILGAIQTMTVGGTSDLLRTVFDCKHKSDTDFAKVARREGAPATNDKADDEAYDYSGDVYNFYNEVYARNSIDDRGMPLNSYVHYAVKYNNAFWDGSKMTYGDGDGKIFGRFTLAIDVVGHELTHGVTENTAGLQYRGQPGALNESMSDVFGSLVKQYVLRQTAEKADWLIGEGLFTSKIKGKALRSMKDPGTAYNDPQIGKDPQPADMAHYVNTSSDNGGVHINSGIPNKAFYEVAYAIGGNAWERAGKIWYVTLTQKLTQSSNFQDCANATLEVARNLYGDGSKEEGAVSSGWAKVGITPKMEDANSIIKPVTLESIF